VAENSFERLHKPEASRGEVRRVGDRWGIAASHAVADDRTFHPPFDKLPPAPPPEAPAPAPTEAQHRAALADARAAQGRADEAVSRASEAHERAIALVVKRRTELAGYAALDSDRFARTLDSLRDDDGGATVPGEDDRLVRREIAKLDLDDAERAEATLMAERAVLATAAGNAAREANRLAMCVLMHTADRLADEHNEHLRQAAAKKEMLHAFDHFSANSGAPMPGKVTSLLLSGGTAGLAKQRDTSSWRSARDQLLADPQAQVEITIPTPTPVMEPWAAARAMAAAYSGKSVPAAEYFKQMADEP
jgi:hypothetical protein